MSSLSLGGLVTMSLVLLSQAAPTAKPWRQCGGSGISGGNLACPVGYTCEVVTSQYSQCVEDGVVQLRRRQQQQATAVTGAAAGGIVERQPIHTYARTAPQEFNMFILGLAEMMAQDETDQFSYYEISGIHGAPFTAWGGEQSPANPPQMGYCTHSSALFATWHRPYLALLEQRITYSAQQVALRFKGEDAQQWKDAADRVRLPYWDWSDLSLAGAVPAAITAPQMSVQTPDGPANIPNPLYSYRFTSRRKNTDFRFQPFRDSSETRRQPPRDMSRSNNLAVEAAMRAGYPARRQNTYNLFSINKFNAFSNRAFRDNSSPAQLVSVESIHDEVHVAAGGNYGHMTYLEFSAFDPIFHLHHCNVDRLVAIYQAIHPGQVVEPQQMSTTFAQPDYVDGQMDTIDTPLYPFRKPDGSYYTSRDVSAASSVWDLGYGYPEVPASYRERSAEELQLFARSRVDQMYGPNSHIQEIDDQSSSIVSSSTAASSAASSALASSSATAGNSASASATASAEAASSSAAAAASSAPGSAVPSSSAAPSASAGSASSSRLINLPSPSAAPPALDDNRNVNKSPVPIDTTTETAPPRREYILHCLFDQSELSGSTQLLFFFGEPPASTIPEDLHTASNLVGTASWFSSISMKMPSKMVSATVPLTDNLRKAGIALDVEEAVDYLEDNLSWVVVNGDSTITDIKTLKIGVSSSDTRYIGGLAEFGTWETHYQVTENKTGGMKEAEKEKEKLQSEKAPRVTNKRGKEKWRKFENKVKEQMGKKAEEVKDAVDEVRDVFQGVIDGLKKGFGRYKEAKEAKEKKEQYKQVQTQTQTTTTTSTVPAATATAAPVVDKLPVGYGDETTGVVGEVEEDKVDCKEPEVPKAY